MKLISFLIVAITALILALLPSLSFAQDWPFSPYIYTCQDPIMQSSQFTGTENYVFHNWYLPNCQNVPIRWKADATIRNNVVTAIQNWTNANPGNAGIPELTFLEVTSGQDVEFKWTPTLTQKPAETQMTNWVYEPTPDASYWTNAIVEG